MSFFLLVVEGKNRIHLIKIILITIRRVYEHYSIIKGLISVIFIHSSRKSFILKLIKIVYAILVRIIITSILILKISDCSSIKVTIRIKKQSNGRKKNSP